jgi:hypothetical protein
VDERSGYIYRHPKATAEELRALVGAGGLGWAWTPAQMYMRGGGRNDDLLQGDEGRACPGAVEVRWRRAGDRYDVLLLALDERQPAGFEPLLAAGAGWRVRRVAYLLQPPFNNARYERATAFLAPDGSTQFVALIGAAREGS